MNSLAAIALLTLTLVAGPLQAQTPGNQPFTIVISAEGPVRHGRDVEIKVDLTNSSDQPLDMGGMISDQTAVNPRYIYDVRDSNGHPVSKRVYPHPELASGRAFLCTVAPGKTYVSKQPVGRLVDMDAPGSYSVQVSRGTSDNTAGGFVRSNTIIVTVLPPPLVSWSKANADPPFEIEISAGKTVGAGSDIWVEAAITNRSKNELAMAGNISSLYQLDPSYVISVRRQDGGLVPDRYYDHPVWGVESLSRWVEPGETFSEGQDISRKYDTTKPGEYVIQFSRRRSDKKGDGVVSSNAITVTVTP